LIGADAAGTPVDHVKAARTALVVGNEGAGLTEAVRAALDETVSIAMPGNAESLNVGVAAGILFYLITVRE
jgi:TrmH family RNA methyltransferase